MLDEAEQLIKERKFDEALSIAQRAQELDPLDGLLEVTVQVAKELRQRQAAADTLVSQARNGAQQNRLTEARLLLAKASAIDPANITAGVESKRLDEAVHRRGKREELLETLQQMVSSKNVEATAAEAVMEIAVDNLSAPERAAWWRKPAPSATAAVFG